MHNKDKHPEIFTALQKAQAELAPLMAERQTHTDAMKTLNKKIASLEQQKRELNDEAMKDAARIRELRADIARFASAMGGKALPVDQ